MKIMVCYVDGSWKPSYPNRVGGAAIIVNDNDTTEELMFYRDSEEMAQMRQICGELIASMESVRIATQRGYDLVRINYDYLLGVEMWVNGKWKAKNKYTEMYKNYMNEMSKKIKIEFIKVKAHSDNCFNQYADYLAKKSLEL